MIIINVLHFFFRYSLLEANEYPSQDDKLHMNVHILSCCGYEGHDNSVL